MVENSNNSKNCNGEGGFVKYVGVASVNVVAVNPSNEKLRSFGWQIADGADEPVYCGDIDRNGKKIRSGRVRFLVRLMDLQDKPIIPLDFWCHDEYDLNKEGNKCKIIDSYVRTAWATKDDVKNKRIPQYSNGPASIAQTYTLCHTGEEQLLLFLFKYLNITPYRVFDKIKNAMIDSKNPGRLTIDDWSKICNGDASEIKEYIALQPENCVKVILGVRTTDENKSYQTFINDAFLSNGAFVGEDGMYAGAKKIIDRFNEAHPTMNVAFSAEPVHEWKETATEIKDNFDQSGSDMPEIPQDADGDPDLPF